MHSSTIGSGSRFRAAAAACALALASVVGCAATPATVTAAGDPSLSSSDGSTETLTSASPSPSASPSASATAELTTSPESTPAATSSPPPITLTNLADLDGHSFALIGLFTDAGGADTMSADAQFVITFDGTTATAETQCGTLTYPTLTEAEPFMGTLTIDFGAPTGPTCTFGTDPAGPPSGQLGIGYDTSAGHYWFSTGFVAWKFDVVMTP